MTKALAWLVSPYANLTLVSSLPINAVHSRREPSGVRSANCHAKAGRRKGGWRRVIKETQTDGEHLRAGGARLRSSCWLLNLGAREKVYIDWHRQEREACLDFVLDCFRVKDLFFVIFSSLGSRRSCTALPVHRTRGLACSMLHLMSNGPNDRTLSFFAVLYLLFLDNLH